MKCQLALLNLILTAVTFVHTAPISHEEIVENSAKGLHLLQFTEDSDPVWKDDDEELKLMRAGVNFFDVTETYEAEQGLQKARTSGDASVATTFPAPSHQSSVTPLLSKLSVSKMQSDLSSLTAFNNRYYKAQTGADASAWILSTVKSITSGRSDITASYFTHSWVQSSIIVKIAGTATSSPVTILGAHMDSINLSNPTNGRAPGADDDGTGSVNLIDTLRVLVSSGFKPSTPLEFHWYSGEEAGLLGSNAIATSYKSSGIKVKAFMELDMSGYFAPGSKEVFALEADYIDEGLNTFLKQLITTYASIPWAMDIPCGYACSDHASWYKQGYPSSFPYEAVTGDDDPNVHTSSDTTSISGFSWTHSLEFAKIAVAFAYELTA
ncbi:aminopeptidase [Macrolepiota fuliginosa MF-IS2]|uniref:Peptide hydrolase n=1 Tax=Macrolepiota fuliginosa MF-IS2 TaxID=1400762 RepID=A0A9P5XRX8_9AGAR|nr:aminopeptidase [Macrolepiota fuliginosa MF-IS2]